MPAQGHKGGPVMVRLPLFALISIAIGAMVASKAGADSGEAVPFPAHPANPAIEGVLTTEGVECPALRTDDGTLYTLAGDLGGFRPGDRVCIVPSPVEMSTCMQGTTVKIEWIGPAPCPAG